MHLQTFHYNPATEKVVPKGAIVLDLDAITADMGRRGVGEVIQALRHKKDPAAFFTSNLRIAEAIEEQTKPPRIPEPGLWGVVEAGVKQHDQRLKWVRLGDNYRPDDSDEYDRLWADLIDPTLIRDGIEDGAK